MSQGEDGLVSQMHSVEMASQWSQVEMDTECTAKLPLEGALNNMDGIEFGQWNIGDAWRQTKMDHNNIIQDQTAEIITGLNKVWLREAAFNKNYCCVKEAAFRFP